jgi:ABC-type Fe3+/spermidine/putrescine transport system ATPase subunit
MARLEIRGIEFAFGAQRILHGVTLDVSDGECVALLGPSGCGKTTTLRAVAGFVTPTAGDIRVGGRSVLALPPYKRNLGLVFQDFALFPHMTVAENVGYGLRMRGVAREAERAAVADKLRLVRLAGMDGRYPAELSGGQRQRVALARALVIEPYILLLDEPLAALDRKLRDQMQVELKRIQREAGITTIIVTHDQEEALSLADRVAVMFDGRIAEVGAPGSLYQSPRSLGVMDFLGGANLFRGTVMRVDAGLAEVACSEGFALRVSGGEVHLGTEVTVGIRPEHVEILAASAGGTPNTASGKVVEHVYKGAHIDVYLEIGGTVRIASVPAQWTAEHGLPEIGTTLRIAFPARHLVMLDSAT